MWTVCRALLFLLLLIWLDTRTGLYFKYSHNIWKNLCLFASKNLFKNTSFKFYWILMHFICFNKIAVWISIPLPEVKKAQTYSYTSFCSVQYLNQVSLSSVRIYMIQIKHILKLLWIRMFFYIMAVVLPFSNTNC